jgi:hypothetical protein
VPSIAGRYGVGLAGWNLQALADIVGQHPPGGSLAHARQGEQDDQTAVHQSSYQGVCDYCNVGSVTGKRAIRYNGRYDLLPSWHTRRLST